MKKIALYGYGNFGKMMAENFRLWWGGEYTVTAIFDKDRAGEKDPFWDLRISDPEKIKEEYSLGTFEAVMLCVLKKKILWTVKEMITDLGVPLFAPGRTEDFAEPRDFPQDPETGISVCRDQYSFHVYKNMLGAVGISAKLQVIYLFDDNGRTCVENYRKYMKDYERYLLSYPFRFRDPLPEKITMEGDWCVLVKPYPLNYWHFTFETADCVYLLEKAGYRGKYIFKEDRSARELLQIMGISPDRLVSTDELELNRVYVFERLFEINQAGIKPMKCPAKVLTEMAEFIRGKLRKDENSPQKLYVKRIGTRRLLNGEEIAVKNGFSVIVPEDYTVTEEMELFYNADIVISAHGASSTNYLYMREGTVFIEVFSDRWHMDINAETCHANGVHYRQIVGKACESGSRDDMFADYTVDEQTFENVIRKAENLLQVYKGKEYVSGEADGSR